MREWTDDMRPRRRRDPMAAVTTPADARARQVALGASLLGAIVTFLYFRYVDVGASAPRPGPGELIFSGVAFALLGAIGLSLSNRWLRPLLRHRVDPASPIDERVRQRALLLPYAIALVTFIGWAMAGIIWGVLWPLMAGTFTVEKALRSLFGTSVIAGVLATAFVFLAVEHQGRRALPRYFPAGDLSSVPGVPRLGVRARLLGVFLLVGALPVSLLGLIAYTRITAMRGASPDEAARLIHDLVFLVLFVAVVGLAMSVVLSVHVARSVAEPLREVERAMDAVADGDLDQRAQVVSTDEIGAVAEGFNRMVQGLREPRRIRRCRTQRSAASLTSAATKHGDLALLNRALALERYAIAGYTAGIPLLSRRQAKLAQTLFNDELAHARRAARADRRGGRKADPTRGWL